MSYNRTNPPPAMVSHGAQFKLGLGSVRPSLIALDNFRDIRPDVVADLVESIKSTGWLDTSILLVRESPTKGRWILLDGHHRVVALFQLLQAGHLVSTWEVPVVKYSVSLPPDVAAFLQAVNNSAKLTAAADSLTDKICWIDRMHNILKNVQPTKNITSAMIADTAKDITTKEFASGFKPSHVVKFYTIWCTVSGTRSKQDLKLPMLVMRAFNCMSNDDTEAQRKLLKQCTPAAHKHMFNKDISKKDSLTITNTYPGVWAKTMTENDMLLLLFYYRTACITSSTAPRQQCTRPTPSARGWRAAQPPPGIGGRRTI
jgi:hypothetical protein